MIHASVSERLNWVASDRPAQPRSVHLGVLVHRRDEPLIGCLVVGLGQRLVEHVLDHRLDRRPGPLRLAPVDHQPAAAATVAVFARALRVRAGSACTMQDAEKATADDATCMAIRLLIADRGEVRTAALLGVSRQTMAQALARLEKHRGSLAVIRAALAANDTTPEAS